MMDVPSHWMWLHHRIDNHTGKLWDEFMNRVEEFYSLRSLLARVYDQQRVHLSVR